MRIEEFNLEDYRGEKIVIYGTTMGGKVIYQCLNSAGLEIDYFCDRSKKYTEFCGCLVKEPCVLEHEKDAIIINALTRSFESACQFMEQISCQVVYTCRNLIKDKTVKDFIYDENEKESVVDFLVKYPVYANVSKRKDIILPSLEVFITEKCTLRCRDCSHLIPRYQEPKDYNISEIIANLQNVLKIADGIIDLIILGGEPLLHGELNKLLDWGYKQEHIGSLTIVSNGSVMPNEHLLAMMQRTQTRIRLSNYGRYSVRLEEMREACAERGITCFVNDELWTDMGEIYDHNYTLEELREIFIDCPFSYGLLLLNGKIYRCPHVAHLNNLGIINSDLHDSIEVLGITHENVQEKRRELRKYLKIGYLEGCSMCNGIKNSIQGIEPAIQGER